MLNFFNRKARILEEENAKLQHQIQEIEQKLLASEASLRAVNAEHEKEIRERIAENTRLRNIVAGRDNTINQLKGELAKYKPYRAKNGRFTSKPKSGEKFQQNDNEDICEKSSHTSQKA